MRNASDIPASVVATLEGIESPFSISLHSATLPPHGQLEMQVCVGTSAHHQSTHCNALRTLSRDCGPLR